MNIRKAIDWIRAHKFDESRHQRDESGRFTDSGGTDSRWPTRDADTMSEAIAMSSPSGRMSKRADRAATERLRVMLFGKEGLRAPEPKQPTASERLRRQAKQLRDLAERGMNPRAGIKHAKRLEAEADKLEKDAQKEKK